MLMLQLTISTVWQAPVFSITKKLPQLAAVKMLCARLLFSSIRTGHAGA
jgi:hypothetical protein